MLPYLLLVGFFAMMAVLSGQGRANPAMLAIGFVITLVFVGLRHHVGMDWNNYLAMIESVNSVSFSKSLDMAEPSYVLLLRFSGQMGWSIYGAYFIGTAIFLAGLFRYARSTPEPWLALLTAMPFLVIVIAMSAARQSVAIGILLWLAARWNTSKLYTRIFFIILAASFHYSALVFLLIAALDLKISRIYRALLVICGGFAAVYFVLSTGQADYYNTFYVSVQDKKYQASGAVYHALLNGFPGLVALYLDRKRPGLFIPDDFHRNLCIIAVAMLPLALFTSTAASRLSLYLFPVSMYFFAMSPRYSSTDSIRTVVRVGLSAAFIGVTAFWLTFANSSLAHRRYENLLLIDPSERFNCCSRRHYNN